MSDLTREENGARQTPWLDLKQTGYCSDAQADGVPCDAVDCDCRACPRSVAMWNGRAARRAPGTTNAG
jgi:hypothetical protein